MELLPVVVARGGYNGLISPSKQVNPDVSFSNGRSKLFTYQDLSETSFYLCGNFRNLPAGLQIVLVHATVEQDGSSDVDFINDVL